MVIYNNIIPFKGFIAINLCGVIFVRNELRHKMSDAVLNHESIHTAQMIETFIIGFYLLYVVEYMIRLAITRDIILAYRTISFEQEARLYERDLNYTKYRKHYQSFKFIRLC